MGLLDSIIGGAGSLVGGVFDSLGLPPAIGHVASGLTNFATGNVAGLVQDGVHVAGDIANFSHGGTQPSPPPGGGGGSGVDRAKQDAGDIGKGELKPEDQAMLDKQEAAQKYNRMITLLTSILQMQHEAQKAIIQNFRA